MAQELEELDETVAGTNSPNAAEAQIEQAETERQKALSRSRSRNSERDFADDDDESLYKAINEDYEADNKELEGYRKNSSDLSNFLRQDPKSASFLSSWRRDGSPIPALVREYGEDIVKDLTNPEVQQKIEEAQTEYLKQIAENDEYEKKYADNVAKSQEMIQGLVDGGEYTQDEVEAAVESFGAKFEAFLMGTIDEATIVDEIKASRHDTDVEEAEANGERRGRNANISKEFNRRKKATDGLPAMPNSNSQAVKEEKEDNTGALGQLAGRRSMW